MMPSVFVKVCARVGREHWSQMVAVEVRQGTLQSNGRG